MLSVKRVCRVVVPLAIPGPKGAGIVPLNELTASSDPKSTYRYSNFHVQFDGRNPSFPSIPAPAEKPTLVLVALKALPVYTQIRTSRRVAAKVRFGPILLQKSVAHFFGQ